MQLSATIPLNAEVYTVSSLNLAVRSLLEKSFGYIWIKGELSNFASPRSGHWYFSLKDDKAQIKAAMFKGTNSRVSFKPTDGMEVFVFAKVSLYPDRGDYQLIIEKMEVSGEGKLRQAFEALKAKLDKEGLFDLETKRPLPAFPTKIGIITSPTGAAIQDILSVLSKRFRAGAVYIYPTAVQGQQAAENIVKAIDLANAHNECEVLIVARGGGSLEDLWPFNEEKVARTVFNSGIPIVSGVGHETDFTITDFVADLRAPTPTAAAVAVSPDQLALCKEFSVWQKRLNHCIERSLHAWNQTIDNLEKRLVSPQQTLKNNWIILNNQHKQLNSAIKNVWETQYNQIKNLNLRLSHASPNQQIKQHQQTLNQLNFKLQHAITILLNQAKNQFKQQIIALDMVNPLATLARGYSITQDTLTQKVITSIKQVKSGDKIATRLKDGWIKSTID